jgi:hypothetical protein
MQFLVYLTVLMVSVSTVLLEVHWLTSPPPQPKPAVQAAASVSSAAPKAEGPNTTLSPVYPKKADASPTQTDSAQQVQTAEDNGPRVIPGATVHPAPAQQPVASATSQSPAQPAQQPVASAAPQQPVQQSASQATTTAPVQKVAAETTGSASREEDTKPAASRINPPPETAASSAVTSRLARVRTNRSGRLIVHINLSRVRDGSARSRRRDAVRHVRSATSRSRHGRSTVSLRIADIAS